MLKSVPNNERGALHLLLVLAAIGVIAFLVVSRSSGLLDNLLSTFYGTSVSQAAETGIFFVDDQNKVITSTTSPTVKVQLNAPWSVTAVQTISSNTSQGFELVKTVAAQTVSKTGFKIATSTDDVSQSGNSLDMNSKTVPLGTGTLGLRFRNMAIPKGAIIKKADLQVKSVNNQWITMAFQIGGDNVGNSAEFSTNSKPASRALTSQKVNHNSNTRWIQDNVYSVGDVTPVIQQIVNRSDWKAGNSLSLILKGSDSGFARKFIYTYDSSPNNAVNLVLEYQSSNTVPAPTPVATSKPSTPPATAKPTVAPTPVPTMTPVPTPTAPPLVVSVTLSEDSNFTKNVQNISIITDPTFANYTFSDTSVGSKTLYAKFKSSTGQEAIFSKSINLTAVTTPVPSSSGMSMGGDSMAMMAWRVGGKNAPNPAYDKCDDGTDVVTAHNKYYVTAYDGKNYPTWHPPVVTNPVTGVGKCYFGHEHGTNPQKYIHWDEIVQHFGKDLNNNGSIEPLVIDETTGVITPGDRAGIPFGIANEHMDQYYNSGPNPVDSLFVRHEDHVGHKIEIVNNEAETQGNSTHTMAQLPGTQGINIPYYTSGSNTYQPTGVVCTHLHKFHQGTHSGDAIRNNLHEVIFHSECDSVDVSGINAPAYYPNNTVLLTGMMSFGNPGAYQRFCLDNPPRDSSAAKVCADGKNSDGSCVITDPLISRLPDAIHSNTLGRNMTDAYCLSNFDTLNPGVKYFNPYEIWQGDFAVYKTNTLSDSTMIAEHGRQWDVLDPVRIVDLGYVNPNRPSQKDFRYSSEECNGLLQIPGGNQKRTLKCDNGNVAFDSPQAPFKGLHRTTYFGRNRISNQGGSQIWWTDPLGGNAVTTQFGAGLKQKISGVSADIGKVQFRIQQIKGSNNFLNDRALQRQFNSGGNTVHAPN